jgi:type I restriction enzyme M protein
MYNNENLPELFREIFKNSFLPFKDPSTLNMFLKEINEFHYSNSEKLGDAFEYLLSFMGSQGDAGQFRTPRHIIDFIVEIVNPQKNETVLDPACGTAGFLISSYKHILKQNTKKNLGDGLTTSDRKKIGENLNGYDISPDMVKMSLVNMYLHKFTNPKINEYDTLSSEDRWNEYYDVILANPPFFSPKGGMMPHNRFGVKSTKAEVLFVDYINEHLKPNGRAGIIVPEGIIFQKGNAYKQLRKKLLETSLIGVISLPSGVFNPYANVKTSILILDKEKNKKIKDIFFVDLKNDGFSLGAQRNKIKDNDIPLILDFLKKGKESKNCILVNKNKILSNNAFTFSSTKYSNIQEINSKFNVVKIIDTFEVLSPKIKINSKNFLKEGKIPIIDQSNKFIGGYWNNVKDKIEISKPVIIFGDHTKIIKYIDFDFVAGADGIKILQPNPNILPKYLYFIIKSLEIADLGYSRHFKELKEKKIPLPSLEVQSQIVEELDNYQKIIDGCRQVIENYKPSIDIDPSWETFEIGEVLLLAYGKGLTEKDRIDGDFNVYGSNGIVGTHNEYFVEGPFIIVGRKGSVGELHFSKNNGNPIDTTFYISKKQLKKDIELELLFYLLKLIDLKSLDNQSAIPGINRNDVYKLKINLPPKESQNKILKIIKDEVEIIDKNKNLILNFQGKIKNKINNIWSD